MNKDVLQAIMLAGEIPKNMQTTDNLVTEISSESTDEQYPSAKATYQSLSNKENIGTWELIDSVDCSGGDITAITRTNLPKKYKGIFISNYSNGMGNAATLLSGGVIVVTLSNSAGGWASCKITTGTTNNRCQQVVVYSLGNGLWHFHSIANITISGGMWTGNTDHNAYYKFDSDSFDGFTLSNGTFNGTIYIWGLTA